MLTENQIKVLFEFSRQNPDLKVGEAWCLDKKEKILYSPVRESKLERICNLPAYGSYKIITAKMLKANEGEKEGHS